MDLLFLDHIYRESLLYLFGGGVQHWKGEYIVLSFKVGVSDRFHFWFADSSRFVVHSVEIILDLRVLQCVCECVTVYSYSICRGWKPESTVIVCIVFFSVSFDVWNGKLYVVWLLEIVIHVYAGHACSAWYVQRSVIVGTAVWIAGRYTWQTVWSVIEKIFKFVSWQDFIRISDVYSVWWQRPHMSVVVEI